MRLWGHGLGKGAVPSLLDNEEAATASCPLTRCPPGGSGPLRGPDADAVDLESAPEPLLTLAGQAGWGPVKNEASGRARLQAWPLLSGYRVLAVIVPQGPGC